MKDTTKGALDRYVNQKLETGGFLLAVLSNDLRNAFAYADEENMRDMAEIVQYVYTELPSECRGSKHKVDRWLGR